MDSDNLLGEIDDYLDMFSPSEITGGGNCSGTTGNGSKPGTTNSGMASDTTKAVIRNHIQSEKRKLEDNDSNNDLSSAKNPKLEIKNEEFDSSLLYSNPASVPPGFKTKSEIKSEMKSEIKDEPYAGPESNGLLAAALMDNKRPTSAPGLGGNYRNSMMSPQGNTGNQNGVMNQPGNQSASHNKVKSVLEANGLNNIDDIQALKKLNEIAKSTNLAPEQKSNEVGKLIKENPNLARLLFRLRNEKVVRSGGQQMPGNNGMNPKNFNNMGNMNQQNNPNMGLMGDNQMNNGHMTANNNNNMMNGGMSNASGDFMNSFDGGANNQWQGNGMQNGPTNHGNMNMMGNIQNSQMVRGPNATTANGQMGGNFNPQNSPYQPMTSPVTPGPTNDWNAEFSGPAKSMIPNQAGYSFRGGPMGPIRPSMRGIAPGMHSPHGMGHSSPFTQGDLCQGMSPGLRGPYGPSSYMAGGPRHPNSYGGIGMGPYRRGFGPQNPSMYNGTMMDENMMVNGGMRGSPYGPGYAGQYGAQGQQRPGMMGVAHGHGSVPNGMGSPIGMGPNTTEFNSRMSRVPSFDNSMMGSPRVSVPVTSPVRQGSLDYDSSNHSPAMNGDYQRFPSPGRYSSPSHALNGSGNNMSFSNSQFDSSHGPQHMNMAQQRFNNSPMNGGGGIINQQSQFPRNNSGGNYPLQEDPLFNNVGAINNTPGNEFANMNGNGSMNNSSSNNNTTNNSNTFSNSDWRSECVELRKSLITNLHKAIADLGNPNITIAIADRTEEDFFNNSDSSETYTRQLAGWLANIFADQEQQQQQNQSSQQQSQLSDSFDPDFADVASTLNMNELPVESGADQTQTNVNSTKAKSISEANPILSSLLPAPTSKPSNATSASNTLTPSMKSNVGNADLTNSFPLPMSSNSNQTSVPPIGSEPNSTSSSSPLSNASSSLSATPPINTTSNGGSSVTSSASTLGNAGGGNNSISTLLSSSESSNFPSPSTFPVPSSLNTTATHDGSDPNSANRGNIESSSNTILQQRSVSGRRASGKNGNQVNTPHSVDSGIGSPRSIPSSSMYSPKVTGNGTSPNRIPVSESSPEK